jgi:hypothetical protein
MLNGEVVGGTDSDGELRHDFRLFQRRKSTLPSELRRRSFTTIDKPGRRIVAEEPKSGGRGPSASSCAMICNAETVPQRVPPISPRRVTSGTSGGRAFRTFRTTHLAPAPLALRLEREESPTARPERLGTRNR